MRLLTDLFTWWNGATLGTRLLIARKGVFVGEDAEGNRFYRNHDDSRRWVTYSGEAEASRISPDWHGWLHHTFDTPPSEEPLPRKTWERDHVPNMTGTEGAYRPPGSVLTPATRPRAAGDYEAWQPE
ncbi:MAG: NADH:ubiquinone oxidoreductase subunit NDUFA12 [Paracoccaceae bacterium]